MERFKQQPEKKESWLNPFSWSSRRWVLVLGFSLLSYVALPHPTPAVSS